MILTRFWAKFGHDIEDFGGIYPTFWVSGQNQGHTHTKKTSKSIYKNKCTKSRRKFFPLNNKIWGKTLSIE